MFKINLCYNLVTGVIIAIFGGIFILLMFVMILPTILIGILVYSYIKKQSSILANNDISPLINIMKSVPVDDEFFGDLFNLKTLTFGKNVQSITNNVTEVFGCDFNSQNNLAGISVLKLNRNMMDTSGSSWSGIFYFKDSHNEINGQINQGICTLTFNNQVLTINIPVRKVYDGNNNEIAELEMSTVPTSLPFTNTCWSIYSHSQKICETYSSRNDWADIKNEFKASVSPSAYNVLFSINPFSADISAEDLQRTLETIKEPGQVKNITMPLFTEKHIPQITDKNLSIICLFLATVSWGIFTTQRRRG